MLGANWHPHTALTCPSVLWGARSGTPGLQPESREPTSSQLRRFLRTYRRRSACVHTFPYMCQSPLCCKEWKCRSQRNMSTNCWKSNMKFLVWLLVPVAFGGQEKSGAELTEELIIAASPFVQDDRGWRPSSIARQLLLSSGDQAWKRRSSGDEGGGVEEEEQQGRSGKALYIPYSPGPDALRWAGNIHRVLTDTRISFYSSSQSLVCVCGLFRSHS